MRAPAGALGGKEGGALSPKALREVWPARRSSPTGTRAGVGCGRLGDPALPGGAPGLGVAGSEIQPYLGDAEGGGDGPRGLDPYREVGGLEG
jgi:hypothetical protein